jgi:hypothetical protein
MRRIGEVIFPTWWPENVIDVRPNVGRRYAFPTYVLAKELQNWLMTSSVWDKTRF